MNGLLEMFRYKLGARGLELPGPNDLDVWGYAETLDLMQELPST